MTQKNVAVLFSGGADSTAAAVHYLERGYFSHLITFDNGAQRGFDRAEMRGAAVAKEFPGRCSWRLLDCKPLFHALAINNLEKDVRRYGNLVCCGCKLAMLVEAILYCKRNDIHEIADGFRKSQDYYPEQTPEYINPADEFARRYGIAYAHPLWGPSGSTVDVGALSGCIPSSPAQPSCLFGENPVRNREFIGDYVRSRFPAMRSYIESALLPEREGS